MDDVLFTSDSFLAHRLFVYIFQIQMEMVRPKNLFAVICHGDLWLSNILFKYGGAAGGGGQSAASEAGGKEAARPVEVKFIDFQSARFASLATDLVLFLFTSVRVSTPCAPVALQLRSSYAPFYLRSLSTLPLAFKL